MIIEPLTHIDQIKKGDALLISNGKKLIAVYAEKVKVTEYDGTEVIYNMRKNHFFNVGMYLEGTSWAKDVRIARIEK